MKFIATLFITMALFLAFKPGIEVIFMPDHSEQSCCIDTCSAEEEETHREDSKDDCEGNFCNPFQSCGSCFFLCLNDFAEKPEQAAFNIPQKFSYQFNASALFIIEFWQPPEMV